MFVSARLLAMAAAHLAVLATSKLLMDRINHLRSWQSASSGHEHAWACLPTEELRVCGERTLVFDTARPRSSTTKKPAETRLLVKLFVRGQQRLRTRERRK